jgi:hypothetical protein
LQKLWGQAKAKAKTTRRSLISNTKYMAKKINEFLKTLIVKAGGNPEDEKLKAALAAIVADTEVNDDVVNAIEQGLISIENAKNNHPDIKKHYTALALNGLDSELERLMEDERFDEATITELKGEKSSTKRAALIAKKIKELEAAKAGQGKAETKALNEKIAELNGELRKIKDNENNIKSEYEKKLRDKDKGYAMRNILSTYQTIYDKLDPETKNISINAILEKNLRSKGYQLDVDENGNLIIATKDGSTAFTDDHRPLTPKIFFDKVMADENLLVVSGGNENQNNNRNNNSNNTGGNQNRNNNNTGGNQNRNQNQNQNQNNNGGGEGNKGNGVLKELLNRAKSDMANQNGTSIF